MGDKLENSERGVGFRYGLSCATRANLSYSAHVKRRLDAPDMRIPRMSLRRPVSLSANVLKTFSASKLSLRLHLTKVSELSLQHGDTPFTHHPPVWLLYPPNWYKKDSPLICHKQLWCNGPGRGELKYVSVLVPQLVVSL